MPTHCPTLNDRGREGLRPPRPPNRTGGFPASGSPVDGFLIGSVSQGAGRVRANNPAFAKKALASLDAVTSADTMRSIERPASAHKHRQPVRAFAPCLALAGTRDALCAGSVFRASTFLPCLPSARLCFTRLSRPSPQRYYAGCDSCPARTRRTGLSAYLGLPSEHPIPNHAVRPEPRFVSHFSGFGRNPRGPQASPWMSRLAAAHRRIGFVLLRAARSPPVASHPASRRRGYLRLHAM
jgi:hypothetical protein